MEGAGRMLQIAGLVVVGLGLVQGLAGRIGAAAELGYMAAGAAAFIAGTLLGGQDRS